MPEAIYNEWQNNKNPTMFSFLKSLEMNPFQNIFVTNNPQPIRLPQVYAKLLSMRRWRLYNCVEARRSRTTKLGSHHTDHLRFFDRR
jgi:hypothetical protein